MAHNGRIFIAGGSDDNRTSMEMYDPTTNTWTLVKPMSTARDYLAMAHFDGRIWAMGGKDGGNILNSCESYDSNTDRWRPESAMLKKRSDFKAIEFNGEL